MFLMEGRGQEWKRWTLGLTACAALSGGERAVAVSAEQILSYNAGRFLIQPQLDLTSQFTGNLFYASRNPQPGGLVPIDQIYQGEQVYALAPPGSKVESDLLWYISPGLEVQYGANPENSLTLSYFHDSILYTENSEFNADQNRIQFDAKSQFGRFTLTGEDSVQWLDTILGGSTAVARRVPISRLVWFDNYRLTYDATMKTDVYVGFRHDLSNYLQPVNLYDQGTIRGLLGATYKMSERIGIFVEGDGGHTDVTQNLPSPFQAPGQDSFVYGGFVGARGNFTARLDGTIKVGYETREFPGVRNATGTSSPAVSLALNYTPSAKLFVNLAFDRRVGVSSQYANQTYTYNTFALTAHQLVGSTGKWMLEGRIGFTLGDYVSPDFIGSGYVNNPPPLHTVPIVVSNNRNDQTYSASVALIYQPRGWLKTSLIYSFEKYTASFVDEYAAVTSGLNDYYVNRVALQIAVGY